MQVLLERREVFEHLTHRFAETGFGRTRIYVLHGYPRSDIGKGNLVARVATLKQSSAIVKFDGFLNTNESGTFPSRTAYDFVVYRRFLPATVFGWPNYLVGGAVLKEFLEEVGGSSEHLMFGPHVAYFFLLKLHESWCELGRPRHLFLEVGGTELDLEVAAFVLPALSILRRAHAGFSTWLLTEASFVDGLLKTRTILEGLKGGLRDGRRYDVVFVRSPAELPPAAAADVLNFENFVAEKIRYSSVYGGECPRILWIPHYPGEGLPGYIEYLRSRRSAIYAERPNSS